MPYTKTASRIFFSLVILFVTSACANDESPTSSKASSSKASNSTTINSTTTSSTQDTTMTNESNSNIVVVKLATSMGDISLELNKEKAPATVNNFLNYLNDGHYDGTIFHRVIPGFMIQGGGFEAGMKQKRTNAPVLNEANNGLKNDNLTVAMARTNDPHSASSQFFINVKDNDFLNFSSETAQGWGYAVFGKVVAGEETIKAIEGVATGQSGGHGDVPHEDVVIISATVQE